jgi:hypothetical protein
MTVIIASTVRDGVFAPVTCQEVIVNDQLRARLTSKLTDELARKDGVSP